jgi:hypothetical protein
MWGVPVYTINYTLTGTAIWPAQWRDPKCFLWTLATDAPSSTFPGNPMDIRMFNSSVGSQIGTNVAWSADNAHTASGCGVSLNSNYQITRMVNVSAPVDLGVAGLGGSTAYTPIASFINTLLNCSSLSTCQTADNSLVASSVKLITNGNTRLNIPVFWMVGTTEAAVITSVQTVEAISLAAGLSPPLNWNYWIGPNGHTSDQQSGFSGQLLPAALNWLLGNSPNPMGGSVH